MAIEKSELRRVMGHFATGVTVITTRNRRGDPFGLTANAVTSVSLAPPLILICVDKAADCHPCFLETEVFVVNILSEQQEHLSRRFATKGIAKFDGVPYRAGRTGCPVLEDSAGHLECRIIRAYDGGDHTIYVAEVSEGDASELLPLLFYRGGYRKLAT